MSSLATKSFTVATGDRGLQTQEEEGSEGEEDNLHHDRDFMIHSPSFEADDKAGLRRAFRGVGRDLGRAGDRGSAGRGRAGGPGRIT